MPLPVADQVDVNVRKVRDAHARALSALESKFWQSDQIENTIRALKSLRKPIDTWAERGTAAAAADKAPGAGGWSGWVRAGDELMRGIDELHDIGDNITLGDVADTAKNVPAETLRVVSTASKAVARATGETVAAALGPVAPYLVGLLVVVGIGAAVYVKAGRR